MIVIAVSADADMIPFKIHNHFHSRGPLCYDMYFEGMCISKWSSFLSLYP